MSRRIGLFVLLLPAPCIYATQLPTRIYTTSDGLPRNYVFRIYEDSKGYLWFCTGQGLCRYDGYRFGCYGLEDGLPDRDVHDVVEANDGTYWVGTRSGLCRFNPASKGRKFSVLIPPLEEREGRAIQRLIRSRHGTIWCGTGNGLYRIAGSRLDRVNLQLATDHFLATSVHAISEGPAGDLWLATGNAIHRYEADECTTRYTSKDVLQALALDVTGALWVGSASGLSRIVPNSHSDCRSSLAPKKTLLKTSKYLVSENVTALQVTADGRIWAGTARGGLLELDPGSRPVLVSRHSIPGMQGYYVEHITEDRNGNRWLASGGGAVKIIRNGFLGYSEADGLGSSRIVSKCATRSGTFGLMSARSGTLILNIYDGSTNRFKAIALRLPGSNAEGGLNSRQSAIHTQTGEWWVGTAYGLARFPQVSRVEELARVAPRIYTTQDGLPGNHILGVYESSVGDIWICTVAVKGYGLAKWNRRSNTFQIFGTRDGLPEVDYNAAWTFAEDRAGGIWIGFGSGPVARFSNGRFRVFTEAEGWVEAARHFHVDRSGRLWYTAHHGLARVDSPEAANPRVKRYLKADGLSSNTTWGLSEDQWGRIYVGTARGLDRIEPESGHVRHYGSADGLPPGDLPSLIAFHDDALWYGTVQGLGRLIPERPQRRPPPTILISGVQTGAIRHAVSDLGESEIRDIRLSVEKAQVQIEFIGLSDILGERLTYQYMLYGYDPEWIAAAGQRIVNYAGLGPGAYRFLVRAVNQEGTVSERHAVVEFTIVPALLDRWWMRVLIALLLGAAAFAAFRYRTARLVELQRIRTRIATDLHDDIGASLSQLAIVSEVGRRRSELSTAGLRDILSQVAAASRDMVESMSDIVWAVDPEKDRVRDLAQRMRRFGSDVCTARGIEFQFQAPAGLDELTARSDLRRNVFLVFKEAINNAARHSGCARVWSDLAIRSGRLILTVSDNGCGFDPARRDNGHGLRSMKERATKLGGELRVSSQADGGTAVVLEAPANHSSARSRKNLHKWVGTGDGTRA